MCSLLEDYLYQKLERSRKKEKKKLYSEIKVFQTQFLKYFLENSLLYLSTFVSSSVIITEDVRICQLFRAKIQQNCWELLIQQRRAEHVVIC